MMESGYYAIGLLSILYYICLVLHTKRLNSSFSGFWLFFTVWNCAIGAIVYIAPDFVDYMVLAMSFLMWIVFAAVEIVILCGMLAIPESDLDYIIILGAQIRGNKITNALERRLNKGIQYLKNNSKTICIVSGGKGKGEYVSEAEAMADYLEKNGIDKNRICKEEHSKTTWHNLEFSKQFIENIEQNKVGIVTNNFHVYRAQKIAEIQGYKKVFLLPASTNLIVFPNYMTREFFAMMKMLMKIKDKNE